MEQDIGQDYIQISSIQQGYLCNNRLMGYLDSNDNTEDRYCQIETQNRPPQTEIQTNQSLQPQDLETKVIKNHNQMFIYQTQQLINLLEQYKEQANNPYIQLQYSDFLIQFNFYTEFYNNFQRMVEKDYDTFQRQKQQFDLNQQLKDLEKLKDQNTHGIGKALIPNENLVDHQRVTFRFTYSQFLPAQKMEEIQQNDKQLPLSYQLPYIKRTNSVYIRNPFENQKSSSYQSSTQNTTCNSSSGKIYMEESQIIVQLTNPMLESKRKEEKDKND